ncbi:MAG: DUF4276 family protein [Chloroflexi bacterium AL-W]|nr:DUF4276 family protein [Chloroflexi bacterium AL-N1]NOK69297.1 DUF4276 family protein [Chloroflexi bacterium AL-N10]NOK76358.1 DUF4276 family protein [Chloroflexi bacterium AL-N5]NOK83475.1 DUF4276 family protein [Chloroflexi bacterium AL-W]NOK91135.1 DUF4276 family protein [Chloroflexi bacterium AL-N15]
MRELRYTLLTDGPSDRALQPLLEWLLQANGVQCAIQGMWADLRRLPHPPEGLSLRIEKAVALYPCDVLFVHRDAERESRQKRIDEIHTALEEIEASIDIPVVPVVPVRMQEAWLLFDVVAIRQSASNPNGSVRLNLPRITDLERRPDPKEDLYELLRIACELHGRRLKRFDASISKVAQRVTDYINDFSPLRELPAFVALEEELRRIIETCGWDADTTDV